MARPRQRRRRRWLVYAAGGALIAGGVFAAIGPAAAWIVDGLADGARVWRLGRIQVDGVSGGWLGALRAEHVAIADDHGVWIEARGAAIDWRPQDILLGALRIDIARANSITIHRQPVLLERRPSGDMSIDLRIGELRVETLELEAPAFGVDARFSTDFAMDLRDKRLRSLQLALRRLDSEDDRLIASYRWGEDYALRLDLESAPGGVIARVLGVADHGVRAAAQGEGDGQTGAATYSAAVGANPALAGAANWSPTHWTGGARLQLDALPRLSGLARRIGASVDVTAAGERAGRFSAHAVTPFLVADLEGALDAGQNLVGPARFVATTARLSDIARESPFPLGAAQLEGELRRARGTTAILATLTSGEAEAFGQRGRFSGPVSASLTRERFELAADLRVAEDAPPLLSRARLRADLAFDRARGRFSLDRAEFVGDAARFTAQGWVNGGDGEFSGEWRARRLEAFVPGLTGEAFGPWRSSSAREAGASGWTTTFSGAGANVAGSEIIVTQLLGPTPRLDARLRYQDGETMLSHARLNGAQLRLGATGPIVRDQVDLVLEASARGPLTLGAAEIGGAVDATGRLTGPMVRPTLSARAVLSSFSAPGLVVERPQIDVTLAPRPRGYAGRARARGTSLAQPLVASSEVAVTNGALRLANLDGQIGAMQAQGSARFDARGASADLVFNGLLDGLVSGVSGRIAGDLELDPESLLLEAQVADASAGELRVQTATIRAQGPLEAIAAHFDLRGRLRRAPLTFEGTATYDASGAQALTIEGRGVLAGADIFTRAPMRARWTERGIEASLDVAMGDGVVQVQWRERGRALSGAAQVLDAPLAPLAAIWGERASGRIDGRASVASDGRGLSGGADLRLTEARFAGRQRGTLDLRILGQLEPNRLQAVVGATSSDGLAARFEADAPVATNAAPFRIALARERRGRATWSVQGPAASLWAAARLSDQSLEGRLDGEGELAFGAGSISGDGHIEIVDGRFEDKLTGVTLVDLDARLDIDDRGVTIERFTASGPRGGRLSATGGSANPREGRVAVSVDDMRVVDRPDARARGSGELALEWEGLHSTLSGALEIVEADIDVAASPEAGIPTLDVIEINDPEALDQFGEEGAPQRNGSTTLDVRLTAPGRVFTRGRGVEAEWSLDLRLDGTARNPRLYGEARAVRGTLALSGQPFEIEDARIVFDGDPMDARIDLTATRDTADLAARIRLVGTARAPEVSFTSEPPLPEDEILPQVLFGRSVEDLSALEAAQLAASLAALSGRASLDLVGAARAAAGLDRFNVRQDEGGGFLVAGGVYLTRDVYVEVARTGIGQAQTRVEWTMRPRLVLITSFLGNGDQRVSLRWRRESD
jgi:translocation and assembly module TamB